MINHRRFTSPLLIVLLCASLSGCFLRPYRFTVTQGNEICSDTVAQLRVGMSAEEVRYLMGTPMLQDAFHDNRWDYLYIEKPGYEPALRYHLTIFFQDGCVADIIRNCLPDPGPMTILPESMSQQGPMMQELNEMVPVIPAPIGPRPSDD